MSTKRTAVLFTLIALVISLLLGVFGSVLAFFNDPYVTWEDLLLAPLAVTPLYAVFVVPAGLVVGLPVIGYLRSHGLSRDVRWLVPAGAASGAVAGSVFFIAFLSLDFLGLGIAYGAVCGAIAAVLWYHLIEKFRPNA